jgi:hypothetical protein
MCNEYVFLLIDLASRFRHCASSTVLSVLSIIRCPTTHVRQTCHCHLTDQIDTLSCQVKLEVKLNRLLLKNAYRYRRQSFSVLSHISTKHLQKRLTEDVGFQTQALCICETSICVFLLSQDTESITFAIPGMGIIRIYLYSHIIAFYGLFVFP